MRLQLVQSLDIPRVLLSLIDVDHVQVLFRLLPRVYAHMCPTLRPSSSGEKNMLTVSGEHGHVIMTCPETLDCSLRPRCQSPQSPPPPNAERAEARGSRRERSLLEARSPGERAPVRGEQVPSKYKCRLPDVFCTNIMVQVMGRYLRRRRRWPLLL